MCKINVCLGRPIHRGIREHREICTSFQKKMPFFLAKSGHTGAKNRLLR